MDTDQILTAEKPSTCDRRRLKRQPWPQKCGECGREIMSANLAGRTLCPECKAEAKRKALQKYRATEKAKQGSRDRAKKWRLEHLEFSRERTREYCRTHRKEMNERRKEWYRENLERERVKGRIRNRMRRGDLGARLEYLKLIGRVQTCPRMKVTMVELPCGKRPECWYGKPCEKVADQPRPNMRGFNMWEF